MPRKYVKKNVQKKFSEYDFKLAYEAVNNGCPIREASETFGVPYTTLNSHVNNQVLYSHKGRPTKFTETEESHLVQAALVLQVKKTFISFLF